MKTRYGFVSNSSSSSFIVFGQPKQLSLPYWANQSKITLGNTGSTKFGWEFNHWSDIGSKINFAYLQHLDAPHSGYLDMLERVIKKHCNVNDIVWVLTNDYDLAHKNPKFTYGYIDHQSSSCEGRNCEIFTDDDTLMDFLFNPNTYIRGGNDNC